MRVCRVFGIFVGLAIAMPVLAQPQCLQPAERTAIAVQTLQTELLAAMVLCSAEPGGEGLAAQYDGWLARHREQLRDNFRVVRQYFRRVHGREGNARFEEFATGVTNEASRQSIANPGFCRDSVQVFQWAMAIDPEQLEPAALTFSAARGIASDACQPEARRTR
jgi:hypothetical protein